MIAEKSTVEAEVFTENGSSLAIVPSGASTGTHEVFELRDKENKDYLDKSVFNSVANINGPISKVLINIDINDRSKIDKILIDLDGTEQKKITRCQCNSCCFYGVHQIGVAKEKKFVNI